MRVSGARPQENFGFPNFFQEYPELCSAAINISTTYKLHKFGNPNILQSFIWPPCTISKG
jgi:hypothetical protein